MVDLLKLRDAQIEALQNELARVRENLKNAKEIIDGIYNEMMEEVTTNNL